MASMMSYERGEGTHVSPLDLLSGKSIGEPDAHGKDCKEAGNYCNYWRHDGVVPDWLSAEGLGGILRS